MVLGITKGLNKWDAQQNSVERHTDNAAYTSAHPDDTLLLAGPPRMADSSTAETSGWKSLLAIGMVQSFQFGSQKPTQMMQAIGSGRGFFLSGKSQTSWNIARLFCNGRNLLRVLYHNAIAGGVNVAKFDDRPVAETKLETFFTNLDSELFYVPFGIGAIFRSKMKDLIGAMYLELCAIQSYSTGYTAGQGIVMENVSGLCDRVHPFHPTNVVANREVPRETVDHVIGFTNKSNMLSYNGQLTPNGDFSKDDVENEGLA